jgi:cytoskeleton protein RodZ
VATLSAEGIAVFQIGSSLRDARTRRGLELAQVERDTRIRPRYLQALEDEQFDLLPGEAYAKGFLRTYADFLGLEGERFVDEYNSRFPVPEEPPNVKLARVKRRRSLLDMRYVAIPVAVLVGLIVWQLTKSGGGHHHVANAPPPPKTLPAAPQHVRASAPKTPTAPTAARVVFAAAKGPCWLSVRVGSETGRVLYEQTLQTGETARFSGKRLWIRIGAPWNVTATLNGKALTLPSALGNVVVTPSGAAQ